MGYIYLIISFYLVMLTSLMNVENYRSFFFLKVPFFVFGIIIGLDAFNKLNIMSYFN